MLRQKFVLFPSPSSIHPDRKKNRLTGFDYSSPGYYFVTICVKDRVECFGEVKDGVMVLDRLGLEVKKCWLEIPDHFPDIILDEFVVMPNHVHGILVIENDNDVRYNDDVGNNNYCSLHHRCTECQWQTKWARSISSAIRGFKIGVKKWCNVNDFHDFRWQKSFYDHIIRNTDSYEKIKFYIQDNPAKWEQDRNNSPNLYM